MLPLPVLLVRSAFWIWQARQFLVRRQTTHPPDLDRLSIAGIDDPLFPPVIFLQLAQGLRRRVQRASQDLDIPKTVRQTVSRLGWFTPVYGYRQVLPEYLVLIDRRSPEDHQARFIEAMLDRLVANGVFITRYWFKGDPRNCFPRVGTAPPCQLEDLVTKHPQDRLVIFSEADGLLNALTGDLETWTEVFSAWGERAVLTPEPPPYWTAQEQELAQTFTVLPLTLEGLMEFIQSLGVSRTPAPARGGAGLPLPSTLREASQHWLQREAPEVSQMEGLLSSLQGYLGPAGYYWFSACAVFPTLRWDVTVYLGQRLLTDEGQALLTPQRLIDMARLPWFRHAYMPDWLRIRLISDLSRHQEQAIRKALADLLLPAVQGPVSQSQLEIAQGYNIAVLGLIAPLLRRLARQAPPESLLKDYLFRDFMLGLKPSRLAVYLPGGKTLRMPSTQLTRQRFLYLTGFASLGLGVGLLLHQWLCMNCYLLGLFFSSLDFLAIYVAFLLLLTSFYLVVTRPSS